jgi:hypothetical protein
MEAQTCHYYLAFENAILIASPVKTLAINHFCTFIQVGFLAKNSATFEAQHPELFLFQKVSFA